MAIEQWIDKISRLWEIDDGKGGTVKSYRLFEVNEFPNEITFPCALTYPLSVSSLYNSAYQNTDIWIGRTEFHIFPSADKSLIPEVMLFYGRIRKAAANNLDLDGSVSSFLLANEGEQYSIAAPVILQYGSENPHWGILVNWIVKEAVADEFSIG